MWLDLPPALSLRRQILDDFAAHATPTGAVTETAKRPRKKSERQDRTEAERVVASTGKA